MPPKRSGKANAAATSAGKKKTKLAEPMEEEIVLEKVQLEDSLENVEDEMEEIDNVSVPEEGALFKKLVFSTPLSGSSVRVSSSELTKRLKALHSELCRLDQEMTSLPSLSCLLPGASDVTATMNLLPLIEHKDLSVRILACSSIVELLRIYAPDCPLEGPALKHVFEVLIEQVFPLVSLNYQEEWWYGFVINILDSLGSIKSILLLLDIDDEMLLGKVYETFFDNVHRNTHKSLKHKMLEIMMVLIDENESVPRGIVEVILNQFSKKRKTENIGAYDLARDLIRACKERLQQHVAMYFTDVIIPGAKESGDNKADLRRVHELVIELSKACDEILLSVIPQLEEELRVDDLSLRLLATQVLGEIFSEKGSNIIRLYPSAWNAWKLKKFDVNSSIRLVWLEYVHGVLKAHPDKVEELADCLCEKLMDSDDKIRCGSIVIVSKLLVEDRMDLIDTMPKDVFSKICERIKDKKLLVRHEAIKCCGLLYNKVFNDLARSDSDLLAEKYGWIPQYLMEASCSVSAHNNNLDIGADIERILEEEVLLTTNQDENNVEYCNFRFLYFYASLSTEDAKRSFISMATRFKVVSPLLIDVVDGFIAVKGNVGNEDEKKCKKLLQTFPEQNKWLLLLKKYGQSNDQTSFESLKKLLLSGKKEEILKRRTNFLNKLKSSGTTEAFRMWSTILRRAKPVLLVNKSDLGPYLVKQSVESSNEVMREAAAEILEQIVESYPGFFQTQEVVGSLCSLIHKDEDDIVRNEVFLKVLSSLDYSKDATVKLSLHELFIDTLKTYATSDNALKHLLAKYSIRILLKLSDKSVLDDLVEESLKNAKSCGESMACALNVLTELQRDSGTVLPADELMEVDDKVYDFLDVSEVSNVDSEENDEEDEWSEDMSDSKLISIIRCLKYLCNRLMLLKEDNTEMAKRFVNILLSILSGNGALNSGTPAKYKAHIRLIAANCFLKVAQKQYIETKLLTFKHYMSVCLTSQDPCFTVRLLFTDKLKKLLAGFKLHTRYLVALLIVPFEPDQPLLTSSKKYLTSLFFKLKQYSNHSKLIPENLLPRYIHFLANHADMTSEEIQEEEKLKMMQKYCNFYLNLVLTQENCSYLYALCERLKSVEDSHDSTNSNLYVLSDLCCHLLRTRCQSHSWSLAVYPGKVDLPGDCFRAIRDQKRVKEVFSSHSDTNDLASHELFYSKDHV